MAEDLNLSRERARILGEIGNLTRQINAYNQQANRDAEVGNRLNAQRLRLARELRGINEQIRKNQREYYVEAQSGIKSLGELYQPIKDAEKSRIDMMMKQQNLSDLAVERGNTLADINRKIASLTADQTIEREILQEQFDSELRKFQRQRGISEEIVDNLKEQNKVARDYASMTDTQKDFLEQQISVYNGIKKAIGGVLETADLLMSTTGGKIGALTMAAGKFVGKLGEVRSQLGGITEFGTTTLAFFDDNAVDNAKELSNQFGGINNVSAELQASTSLISTNMGISGVEAAGLLGSLARLNDGSDETALNLAKSTQEFAKQNGIIPSQLMEELAGSAEEFALFGKQGGKNLIEAGAAARKMGVSVKTMTGIAENLLDFESSITKEMELGALLGRNINLDRARALAYQGDITGATKETLNALGGIEAFNKMDYFQKKATADLLGVSVDELQKMAAQQENVGTTGDMITEKFSLMGETINAGINKYLGTSLEGLGGMLIAAGQLNMGFGALGTSLGGVVKGTGQILSNLLQMVAGPVVGGVKSIGTYLANSAVGQKVGGLKDRLLQGVGGGAKPAVPSADVGGKATEGVSKFGKINATALLKGAAAMLIMAGALYVTAKALQEFNEVEWDSLAKAGVALVGLGIIMAGFGALSGLILTGSIALAAASVGLMLFGAAIMVVGSGLKIFSEGLTAISSVLPTVVDPLSQLSQINFLPIFGLAGALTTLAVALTAVAVAGIAALPVIAGLGLIAGGAEMLFGGGGEGGEKTDKTDMLIEEIKGLRADLNSGKIAVYMDGKKVTSGVAKVVNTTSTNSYVPK